MESTVAFDQSSSSFVAGEERAGVANRLERRSQVAPVLPDLIGHRVGDGQRHLDVGQAAGEDPEAVETGDRAVAGVEDLDDQLGVVGAEEPELAGVVTR